MIRKRADIIGGAVFALGAFFIFIRFSLGLDPLRTARSFFILPAGDCYRPNHNYFSLPSVDGINLNLWAYILVLFLVLGIALWRLIRRQRERTSGGSTALRITTAIFIALVVFQTVGQARYFVKTAEKFRDKSLEQKFDLIYNLDSYRFVRLCREHLSGRYQGRIVSDSGFNDFIDLFLIMYYLYPVVDFRQDRPGRDECLLAFNKTDPFSAVPTGFKVIVVDGPRNLLAVKKKGPE